MLLRLTYGLKMRGLAGLRGLATTAGQAPVIFDKEAKRQQRDRAALNMGLSRETDYLKDEVGARIVDRLLDIKRRFPVIVDVGAGAGHIAKHLDTDMTTKVVQVEHSELLGNRDKDVEYEVEVQRMVGDVEALPFPENSLDAVVSTLNLHWVNDLPGALFEIRRVLRPDGAFIGAILGGDTLYELRTSMQLAESERLGGISPRVSPMANVGEMGQLLSRAGFQLTTVDVDDIVVNYPSMFELMTDLQAMGESNAVISRQPLIQRDTLLAAAAIYKELHGNEDGSIPATFQVLYMIGWKPDPSQAKPLKRGTAKKSLKDAL